ncbi:MFS transporter [Burkholderia sp. 3C]
MSIQPGKHTVSTRGGAAEAADHASLVPIYCMALGTFAIGTEVYMIAPLLPRMAVDFGRSLSAVALLITVFTLTLALSSPILTVLGARLNRRKLLLAAIGVFAAGNFVAWASTDFFGILMARIILAISAGLYVPNASALAGVTVGPNRRATALAIVNSGTTIAVALGLPLGSLIGNAFGWRMTFLAVGVMAIIAAVGIAMGVPATVGDGLRVPGFRERVTTATRPRVWMTLLVTLLWAAAVYTAYPMIAPFLVEVAKVSGWGITAMLSLWGVSAAAGVLASGKLTDRFGSTAIIIAALAFGILAFLFLAAIAFSAPAHPVLPVAIGLVCWGFSAWGVVPALMARLVKAGGVSEAPISLSLNYSVMYAGFSLGSWIGARIVAQGGIHGIDLIAACLEAAALIFFLLTRHIIDRSRT